MNKTFYVLLCLISSHAFAGDSSDDGGQDVGVHIEEEELEGENPYATPPPPLNQDIRYHNMPIFDQDQHVIFHMNLHASAMANNVSQISSV